MLMQKKRRRDASYAERCDLHCHPSAAPPPPPTWALPMRARTLATHTPPPPTFTPARLRSGTPLSPPPLSPSRKAHLILPGREAVPRRRQAELGRGVVAHVLRHRHLVLYPPVKAHQQHPRLFMVGPVHRLPHTERIMSAPVEVDLARKVEQVREARRPQREGQRGAVYIGGRPRDAVVATFGAARGVSLGARGEVA
eukprot:scaffold1669_cov108-Isochrysis_galbana.AAC.12